MVPISFASIGTDGLMSSPYSFDLTYLQRLRLESRQGVNVPLHDLSMWSTSAGNALCLKEFILPGNRRESERVTT